MAWSWPAAWSCMITSTHACAAACPPHHTSTHVCTHTPGACLPPAPDTYLLLHAPTHIHTSIHACTHTPATCVPHPHPHMRAPTHIHAPAHLTPACPTHIHHPQMHAPAHQMPACPTHIHPYTIARTCGPTHICACIHPRTKKKVRVRVHPCMHPHTSMQHACPHTTHFSLDTDPHAPWWPGTPPYAHTHA